MRRRTAEGMSKIEVMCRLERYMAREIYYHLQTPAGQLTSNPA